MEKVRKLLVAAILSLFSLVSLSAEELVQNFTGEFIIKVVRLTGMQDGKDR